MFIKKDLRKIPRILADAAAVQEPPSDDSELPPSSSTEGGGEPSSKKTKREILTELRLQRRTAEFRGNVNILCQPQNAPALHHLVNLSLYDCQITSLDGIGRFLSGCSPNLQVLDVGHNPLQSLPDEIALLGKSLKQLWCDDCQITGSIPKCVMDLTNLETLRLSQNRITTMPAEIHKLQKLKTLCLDRNQISQIPSELSQLGQLEAFMIRQNQLESLPEGVPGKTMANLSVLHVSSNRLTSLPTSLGECTSLQTIYVNGNEIQRIPDGVGHGLPNLKRFNASHNRIRFLPSDFIDRFGYPDETTVTGACEKDTSCVVLLCQNPVLDQENDNSDETGTSAPMILA
mmetsp:Transcript_21155/g.29905  ORF Transcript_21155/g.29905 Transcript_21155/m.29905 type:complete len:345 (+) Transcript_21155:90-1124(+)